MEYPQFSVPWALEDYDFCLLWAMEVNLTRSKAETIVNSFNLVKTTKDKISNISHHIIKSFFLWFAYKNTDKYVQDAKKELEFACKIVKEWEKEVKIIDYSGYFEYYIDGIEYVIYGMKMLLDPEGTGMSTELIIRQPYGKAKAGVLHIKQEFFRPFVDEIDRRVAILKEIRKLNDKDSRACLYLSKTLGQKRKMENFLSTPSIQEMALLVEGHVKSRGDFSIIIELCYCFAQLLRNNKNKTQRYPLSFYNGSMIFKNEKAIADFINKQTTEIWISAPDAAPLYVKLAEIQSSLLPVKYQHPSITPLVLVNRALEKYNQYSKALHRKAKILFKLRDHEEGLRCLEAAFKHSETNCDALCDLVFRLLRFPNQDKLVSIFNKYCNNNGENLWGKRKVGTLYYLCGCYCWMMNDKLTAAKFWLEAEKRNPNPTFYFQNLYTQKTNYKWHRGNLLTFEDIIKYLRSLGVPSEDDRHSMDCLISKLNSLIQK